ncbi:MAG: hypothetical protein GY797_04600 [Deltaproteobacteria bacterium]|nr:hypothetical protein [Deltaproteobacteria bacterium]
MIENEMRKYNVADEVPGEMKFDDQNTEKNVEPTDAILDSYKAEAESYEAGVNVESKKQTEPIEGVRVEQSKGQHLKEKSSFNKDNEVSRELKITKGDRTVTQDTNRVGSTSITVKNKLNKWGFFSLGLIFLSATLGVLLHGYFCKRLLFNSWVLRLLTPLFFVIVLCVSLRVFLIEYYALRDLDPNSIQSLYGFVNFACRFFVLQIEPDLTCFACALAGIVFYFSLGTLIWLVSYFK